MECWLFFFFFFIDHNHFRVTPGLPVKIYNQNTAKTIEQQRLTIIIIIVETIASIGSD